MTARALVLAAGLGSRLSGFRDVPKPLVEFRGRRLIEWNLHWLAASGVRDVWINLHREPPLFRRLLGDGAVYGVRIRYSEEPHILGTAGGWKQLRAEWTGPSLVIYGDNVMRFDLAALARAHRDASTRALCTIALFDTAKHAHTGIAGSRVELDGSGRIAAFREGTAQGVSGLVNAGAYVVEPALADWIGDGFQDFGRDVFPDLVARGALRGHVIEAGGFCLGLDTPESFATAELLTQEGRVQL